MVSIVTKWTATIKTKNTLTTTEFESLTPYMNDALIEAKSRYGTDDIKLCSAPTSSSTNYRSSGNYNNSFEGTDLDSWLILIAIGLGMMIIYYAWWIIIPSAIIWFYLPNLKKLFK